MGDPRPVRLLAPVGRLGPVGGLHRGGFRSRQHSRATRSGPPSRGTARRCRRQALTWHRWSAMMVTSARRFTEIALEQHVPLTVEEFLTAEPLPRYSDRGSGHGALQADRTATVQRGSRASRANRPRAWRPAQRCGLAFHAIKRGSVPVNGSPSPEAKAPVGKDLLLSTFLRPCRRPASRRPCSFPESV